MKKEPRKAAIIFIFITVLIDVIGIGIIIPIIPVLIQELSNGTVSQASEYAIWLVLAYSTMQFVFSPIMGGLSDQYGRRPVLLTSLFGFGIDYLFLAFAPTMAWLFVGRIIAGITGASFTTANAYIADVSSKEKRAQNFGLLGAAFGLGFIIGPSLGGILGTYGSRIPFYVSAGLTLLNWLYGYFVLPESLPKEKRRKFDFKRANPIGSLKQLKKHPLVFSLAMSLFLVYVANYATQGTWSFYTMEKFKWTELEVGLSLGFVGLMVALVQGGLIRIIIPKIGQKNALFTGLTITAIGLLAFGFANQGWLMYAIMVPFALSGLANPAFQGIISNMVEDSEQGELQGALTSLIAVAAIIGQPLMLSLFRNFTSENNTVYFPGAPFIAGSILTVISIALTFRTFKKSNL